MQTYVYEQQRLHICKPHKKARFLAWKKNRPTLSSNQIIFDWFIITITIYTFRFECAACSPFTHAPLIHNIENGILIDWWMENERRTSAHTAPLLSLLIRDDCTCCVCVCVWEREKFISINSSIKHELVSEGFLWKSFVHKFKPFNRKCCRILVFFLIQIFYCVNLLYAHSSPRLTPQRGPIIIRV